MIRKFLQAESKAVKSRPMASVSVSEELKDLYDNYYDGPSDWRALGAVDKVNNIVSLCNGCPHKSILEIGFGDGSILKR